MFVSYTKEDVNEGSRIQGEGSPGGEEWRRGTGQKRPNVVSAPRQINQKVVTEVDAGRSGNISLRERSVC
ncbi:hypothetical protein E2C01_037835 [Portunus trituberculatus]|uniref:Uncharacterized protein n=1 Tax=Portunus trituberculatus TaxID=210409 RepID=A0A5B7FAD9_PORTR|nr:hypothetical protein [Portunus trituberculatus]